MHFEYIADAATRGIAEIGLATGVPVSFGVLTTLTDEQAEMRVAARRRQQGPGGRGGGRGDGDAAARDRRRPGGMSGAGARQGRATARVAPPRPRGGAPDALPVGGRPAAARRRPPRVARSDRRGRAAARPSCTAFATALAEGVAAHVAELDPLISEAAAHWRLERMNVVDRLVMRLAVYEFLHERDTPATVIINEALELARAFSSDEAVPFVNGVLDGIRRRLERA